MPQFVVHQLFSLEIVYRLPVAFEDNDVWGSNTCLTDPYGKEIRVLVASRVTERSHEIRDLYVPIVLESGDILLEIRVYH